MSDEKGPFQDSKRGKLFKVLAIVVGLGLLVLTSLGYNAVEGAVGGSLLLTWSLYGALAGTLLIGALLWEYGARHLAASGADAVRSDPRAPVIYLRSFATESGAIGGEQDLSRVLNEVGPFVAIGDPGDKLPPLGAARFYERHFASEGRDWQAFVRELLGRSALVFVVPGTSTGLAWELARCRELLRPERLFILIHARMESFSAIQAATVQAGLALPDASDLLERHGGRDEFIGLVAFKQDWSAYLLPFPSRQIGPYADDASDRERRLRQALSAVLEPLGFPMRGWPSQSLILVPIAIVIAAALIIFLVSRLFAVPQ